MRMLLVVLLSSLAFGCATLERFVPMAEPICRLFWEDDVCDAVGAVSEVVEEAGEEEEPDE